MTPHLFQRGDIIGVFLDLSVPQITFSVNGMRVKGFFRDFNIDGMFFPVISVSSKVRCVKIGNFFFKSHGSKLNHCQIMVNVRVTSISTKVHISETYQYICNSQICVITRHPFFSQVINLKVKVI